MNVTIHSTSSATKFSTGQDPNRARQATAHRVPQQGRRQGTDKTTAMTRPSSINGAVATPAELGEEWPEYREEDHADD